MQRLLSILYIGCLLLFTHSGANAQEQFPDKRNLIGAGLSFNNSTGIYDGRSNNVNTSITYAHYLKKNLALGAALSYGHSTYDAYDAAVNDYESLEFNGYYFAPFVRFDIPIWQSRLLIFNQLGVNGGYNRSTYHYPTHEDRAIGWGLGASYNAGLMYRLKSNIAFQVGYGLLSYGYASTYASHYITLAGNGKLGDLAFGVNFLF